MSSPSIPASIRIRSHVRRRSNHPWHGDSITYAQCVLCGWLSAEVANDFAEAAITAAIYHECDKETTL